MITQERLKEILHYDPDSGVFTWLSRKVTHRRINAWNTKYAGTIAGTIDKQGYIKLYINKKNLLSHQLAFIYMIGQAPDQVDHINHHKNDNRWSNLRAATRAINSRNQPMSKRNKTGTTGIYWKNKKWAVSIRLNNK